MRGADPAIVLVPGIGMFSFGANKQTARVAGEFYVNAINVMRGAEALSTLHADRRVGEVPDRVLGARGGEARAHAQAQAAGRQGRPRHRRRVGDRPGHRHPAGGRRRLRGRRRHRRIERRGRRARAGRHGHRHQRHGRRDRRGAGRRGVPPGRPRLRRRRPRRQQRRAVDLEAAARDDRRRLGPPARRHGPRLVPRLARGGPGHDRPGDRRRPRLHRQQERVLRRAEQRRLRRVQGRPGAPGPAAGGRARPVRHPRQRGQSRRRGARLRDLRQGLGRGPGADVRRAPRTSSASSMRSGRCSSARSCPSMSRRRSSP